MDEVLKMLRIAYDGGTRDMVATPHMFSDSYNNNDPIKINDGFARTVAQLNKHQESPGLTFLKEMTFHLGSENYVSGEFLEQLDRGCVLTLGGSRYLLVEFSPLLSADKLTLALKRVFKAGFVPILAHTEHIGLVVQDLEHVVAACQMGCLIQINADSILGKWGSRTRKIALSLLNRDLVHVIASDGHV